MSISEALSEELEVINAIFGQGTCQVIRTSEDQTRIRLRLPAASYESVTPNVTDRDTKIRVTSSCKRIKIGSDIIFLVDFPNAYPQLMPQVASLDVSLFEYYEGMWKVHFALIKLLIDVFRAGEVCIYDWFLACSPAVHCLGPNGLDLAKFAKIAPDFDIEEKAWRWAMSQTPLDLDKAFEPSECTICLDESFAYQMVDMVCGHVFCIGCFHGKPSKSSYLPPLSHKIFCIVVVTSAARELLGCQAVIPSFHMCSSFCSSFKLTSFRRLECLPNSQRAFRVL